MNEAERVLDRLRRIELLERQHAPAGDLLAELRALLGEAEEWVRTEAAGEGRAARAVDALDRALDRVGERVPAPERTLVA